MVLRRNHRQRVLAELNRRREARLPQNVSAEPHVPARARDHDSRYKSRRTYSPISIPRPHAPNRLMHPSSAGLAPSRNHVPPTSISRENARPGKPHSTALSSKTQHFRTRSGLNLARSTPNSFGTSKNPTAPSHRLKTTIRLEPIKGQATLAAALSGSSLSRPRHPPPTTSSPPDTRFSPSLVPGTRLPGFTAKFASPSSLRQKFSRARCSSYQESHTRLARHPKARSNRDHSTLLSSSSPSELQNAVRSLFHRKATVASSCLLQPRRRPPQTHRALLPRTRQSPSSRAAGSCNHDSVSPRSTFRPSSPRPPRLYSLKLSNPRANGKRLPTRIPSAFHETFLTDSKPPTIKKATRRWPRFSSRSPDDAIYLAARLVADIRCRTSAHSARGSKFVTSQTRCPSTADATLAETHRAKAEVASSSCQARTP